MRKKFLLISQVFYPDQVSTANLFTGLCAVLAERDIDIEVWAAHPSYTEHKRQPGNLQYKGIDIHFLKSTNFSKDNLLGRFINILTFTISASFKILFSGSKTPIWTHTTPPFTGIIISFICSFKKRKFVYILLDVFPEGLIRLDKVNRKNPLISLWNKLFLKALEKSEKIIVIGRDMRDWIDKICTPCREKIFYIPHWQDDTLIFPIEVEKNKFVIENKLENKFIVQYSGNMGLWSELKTPGSAVRKNIKDVFFLFIGGGFRKQELLNEFRADNQTNVLVFPFQPKENFNLSLNASHVHLVTLKQGLEGMAVPCKIYGILAAGRPVIAMVPKQSEIAYVVREENCGYVLDPEDLDGLINAIISLKNNESLRQQMGYNSRIAFEKKYTERIISKKYETLLTDLYRSTITLIQDN